MPDALRGRRCWPALTADRRRVAGWRRRRRGSHASARRPTSWSSEPRPATRAPAVEVVVGSFDPAGARLLDLVEVMDRLRRECPWDQRADPRVARPLPGRGGVRDHRGDRVRRPRPPARGARRPAAAGDVPRPDRHRAPRRAVRRSTTSPPASSRSWSAATRTCSVTSTRPMPRRSRPTGRRSRRPRRSRTLGDGRHPARPARPEPGRQGRRPGCAKDVERAQVPGPERDGVHRGDPRRGALRAGRRRLAPPASTRSRRCARGCGARSTHVRAQRAADARRGGIRRPRIG